MSLLTTIAGLVSPIGEVIDDISTSDEERLNAKARLQEVSAKLISTVLTYEQQLIEAQSKVITAEANGQSWLQRSWRPITMLTFLVLVVCDSFGWLEFRLSDKAWDLLQLGLGGYVIGRSAEKVLPKIADVVKKRS